MTPDLAELRRLVDVNRERYFHALPWHAWDRGIGYELHVGATCRDEMEPRGYCEEVNNGFRETFGAPEAELIVAAVNALPALLDAAAERDALAAKVERVCTVGDLTARHIGRRVRVETDRTLPDRVRLLREIATASNEAVRLTLEVIDHPEWFLMASFTLDTPCELLP